MGVWLYAFGVGVGGKDSQAPCLYTSRKNAGEELIFVLWTVCRKPALAFLCFVWPENGGPGGQPSAIRCGAVFYFIVFCRVFQRVRNSPTISFCPLCKSLFSGGVIFQRSGVCMIPATAAAPNRSPCAKVRGRAAALNTIAGAVKQVVMGSGICAVLP